jgi:hypothetical protein
MKIAPEQSGPAAAMDYSDYMKLKQTCSLGISASGGTIGTMGNNMVVNNDIDIAGSINVVTFLPR